MKEWQTLGLLLCWAEGTQQIPGLAHEGLRPVWASTDAEGDMGAGGLLLSSKHHAEAP